MVLARSHSISIVVCMYVCILYHFLEYDQYIFSAFLRTVTFIGQFAFDSKYYPDLSIVW
jgi:hypothetical protein